MLPRVKINFANGALNQVTASPDGVLGLILTGVAVAASFELSKAYVLRSLANLDELGITEVNNPHIYKTVKEFYAEAGEGTEVWLMAFPNTLSVSDITDVTKDNAKKLINAANGRLRGLIVSRKPDVTYTPTITNGLDGDISTAMANAQALAEWATDVKFAPLFVLLEGYAYSGNAAELSDLKTNNYNRVGMFIGDTVAESANAAMGIVAGRIAKSPVQKNIGRVADGSVASITAFVKDKAVEVADVESLNDKGYITFRTFTGRAGYFISDDHLATSDSDDYSHLTARRTIDKAYRIIYTTMLEILLQEFPVTNTGAIQHAVAKSWEAEVEQDVALAMTSNGELSSVDGDNGVQCEIDKTVNIVATSKVNMVARVRPFGYARFVDVALGFTSIN